MHISAQAEGYDDGELFLEPIAAPRDIDDVVVKLRRSDPSRTDERACEVSGSVSHDGTRVVAGWAELLYPQHEADTLNVELLKSCPVPQRAWPIHALEIAADGTFKLAAVHPGKPYLVVRVPGHAPLVRSLHLPPGERPRLDLTLEPAASIAGRVTGIPDKIAGRLWVVAFDQHVIRHEARVASDGTFRIDGLPPGSYGVRVGHDAFDLRRDAYSEVFRRTRDGTCRPWAGIKRIELKAGEVARDVVVPFEK